MSGGSWDYCFHRIDDISYKLIQQDCPLRKALGHHLCLVSKALHDIEWVDNSDYGEGDEIESINNVLNNNREKLIYSVIDSKINELNKFMDKLKILKGE